MASTSGLTRRCDQPAVRFNRVARARRPGARHTADAEQAAVAIGQSRYARRRAHMPRKPRAGKPQDVTGSEPRVLGRPVFAQPQPTPDPKEFEIKHPSDNPAYKQIDALNREHKLAPLHFPAPRDLPEPRLTLAAVLGENETTLQKRLAANGQGVFHAVGDTGSTRGPDNQNLVSDKMVNDFTDADQVQPSFFFHLGDVIYSFGEAKYYYDQFYEPYRDYPAPIIV